ncbi:MAG: hypothetical protein JSS02_07615, partial [Planctomycetes bacterium]|nr:hypothetical protein [Planctomycetota bacterium]
SRGTVWGIFPSSPMPTFHSVKEAARLTGKSPSSIRRIIYPILQNDAHPDRDHIHPSPDEARELRLQGATFGWQISDELLRREIPANPEPEQGSPRGGVGPSQDGYADLIDMLRAELATKNEQIANQAAMLSQQMELISGLSERLREGNVLIGTLQQQLRLSEVNTPSSTHQPVDANPVTSSAASDHPSDVSTVEPSDSPPPKPKKRGLFSWLLES